MYESASRRGVREKENVLRTALPALTGKVKIKECIMKITDDYKAKIRLCAANPRVVPLPPGPPIPKFPPQKFNSYEEMNRWKAALIRECARTRKSDG